MKSLIFKKVLAGATMAGLLSPLAMFAQTTTPPTSNQVKGSPQAFCVNVDSITNRVYSVMLNAQSTFNTSRNLAVTNSVYTAMDAKVAKATTEAYAESLNNKVYLNLSARAKTQEQKDALATFKTTYEAAQAKLKSTNSLAITTYKAGVDKVLRDRNTKINDSFAAYQTAINIAIAKAKADCKAGTDSVTVYTAFSTSVKAANSTVAKNSKMNDMRAAVEPLNQTFAKAITDSRATFKATVKPAYEALTATFKVSNTTTAQEGGTVTQ